MSSSRASSSQPITWRTPSFGQPTQPLPPRRWSDGSLIRSLPTGWRSVGARPISADLQLFDLEDETGLPRTWFADGAGQLLGHRPDCLPHATIALLRHALQLQNRLQLHGEAGLTPIDSDYMSEIVLDPVVQAASGLQVRDAEGRLHPIHHPDGTPFRHLDPGWSAPVLFTGFAPLYVLDLHYVAGLRSFWYLDEAGRFVGATVSALDETMLDGIRAYAQRQHARGPDRMHQHLTGYVLLNSLIQGEIDPLLGMPERPAIATRGVRSDRSLDFAMVPQQTRLTHLERLSLRQDGTIDRLVSSGWHNLDGSCLASGQGASLSFELPYRPTVLRLSLALRTIGRARHATVRLNGWDLATIRMDPHLPASDRRDIWVPAECLQDTRAGTRVRFELDFDVRDHGIACGLELAELDIGPRAPDVEIPDIQSLMTRFASLGPDCEFGFVQRVAGVEPLGLFRFAGYGHHSNLVRLIETDFDGLGSPGSLVSTYRREQFYRPDGTVDDWEEFFMADPVRQFRFHTWSGPKESSEAEALLANERKLAYLARALIEDLEDGEKIWVYRDTRPVADHGEAFSVLHAINRKGPNRLFWVTRMAEGRPPGSVEWVARNLLRGYSDQPHADPKIFDPDTWRTLCTNAYRAFAEGGTS